MLINPLTSVGLVERRESHHKEGGRVFAGVYQVREGALGVSVTPQALHEAEPGRQALDDGPHTVRICVARA